VPKILAVVTLNSRTSGHLVTELLAVVAWFLCLLLFRTVFRQVAELLAVSAFDTRRLFRAIDPLVASLAAHVAGDAFCLWALVEEVVEGLADGTLPTNGTLGGNVVCRVASVALGFLTALVGGVADVLAIVAASCPWACLICAAMSFRVTTFRARIHLAVFSALLSAVDGLVAVEGLAPIAAGDCQDRVSGLHRIVKCSEK
jgi:hypothetical protein